MKIPKLDKTDSKILTMLLIDARMSFTQIGNKCGIGSNSVKKRFERMKRDGIIAGTSVILDLKERGYQFALAITMEIEQKQREKIVTVLKENPGFISVDNVLGDYDIHATILASNFNDIEAIRGKLKYQIGIKKLRITASADKVVMYPENLVINEQVDSNDRRN